MQIMGEMETSKPQEMPRLKFELPVWAAANPNGGSPGLDWRIGIPGLQLT